MASAESPPSPRLAHGGRRARGKPRSAPAVSVASSLGDADAPRPEAAPAGRIAFMRWDHETIPVLHWILPDGSGLRRVASGHTPQWSPDGSRLAFLADRPVSNLFVVAVGGGKPRQLTYDGVAVDPQWSPTGGEIAYVVARPTGAPSPTYSPLMPVMPGWDADINAVTTDGTPSIRPVVAGPSTEYEPSWSPDGSRISYLSSRSLGVYVAGRDGSGERRVWDGPDDGYLMGASWGSSGRIAVGTYDAGLWSVAPDGSPATRLGIANTEWSNPMWSPSGDAVLFRVWPTRDSDGEIRIAAITVTGELLFSRHGTSGAWSPDGRHVAFCNKDGLWRMDRDGTDSVRLADATCDATHDGVAWSAPTGG